MNLYFRLLISFVRAKFSATESLFATFKTDRRVLLNDLDLFGHMNNGRICTLTDIERINMLLRSRIWAELKKNNIFPVLAGVNVQFRQALYLFQAYTLFSKIIGWDEKFFYVEHKLTRLDNVCALMVARIRVVGKNAANFTPQKVLQLTENRSLPLIQMDDVLLKWDESNIAHWHRVIQEKDANRTS